MAGNTILPQGNQIVIHEEVLGPGFGFHSNGTISPLNIDIQNNGSKTYIVRIYEIQTKSNLQKAKESMKKLNGDNRKTIVIAGSFREFEDYVRGSSLPHDNFIYAAYPEQLRGVEAHSIIKVGTYHNLPNLFDLLEVAESRLR